MWRLVSNNRNRVRLVILGRKYEQFKKAWWFCIHLRSLCCKLKMKTQGKLQRKFESLAKYEKLPFFGGVASMVDRQNPAKTHGKKDFHRSPGCGGFRPLEGPSQCIGICLTDFGIFVRGGAMKKPGESQWKSQPSRISIIYIYKYIRIIYI